MNRRMVAEQLNLSAGTDEIPADRSEMRPSLMAESAWWR
jgi:hypothetical protein